MNVISIAEKTSESVIRQLSSDPSTGRELYYKTCKIRSAHNISDTQFTRILRRLVLTGKIIEVGTDRIHKRIMERTYSLPAPEGM
jgi:hypothetical protein